MLNFESLDYYGEIEYLNLYWVDPNKNEALAGCLWLRSRCEYVLTLVWDLIGYWGHHYQLDWYLKAKICIRSMMNAHYAILYWAKDHQSVDSNNKHCEVMLFDEATNSRKGYQDEQNQDMIFFTNEVLRESFIVDHATGDFEGLLL